MVQVHKREGVDTENISSSIIFSSTPGFLQRKNSKYFSINRLFIWNDPFVVLSGAV